MTSWPILERELRVWSRRRATYWGRFAIAAAAMLASSGPLLWSGSFVPAAASGRSAFDGLVGAAFLLCCAACLLSADAVGSERREGTLGLLLLTRVRHLDLLLGKFASSGLACVLGLLAFMPVLMLPLLNGGVSGGEAARKWLALMDTLFMALSVGLCASARRVERFRTAVLAVLLLAGFVVGPALLGMLLPRTDLGLASPLAALSRASDPSYRLAARSYWLSLGLVQVISWGFLLGAMFSLNRGLDGVGGPVSGQVRRAEPRPDGNRAATAAPFPHPASASASETQQAIRCSYCGRRNHPEAVFCHECATELRPKVVEQPDTGALASAPTPLHWLLSRQRGLKPALWVAALIGCCHLGILQVALTYFGVGLGPLLFSAFPAFTLATAAVDGILFAWVASRFFVEGRRTGELELLLTSPLGAEQLVETQWENLKRMAQGPVLVMTLLPLVLEGSVTLLAYAGSGFWRPYYVLALLLRAVETVLAVGALFWLAPWFAFRVSGQGRVIFWTVLLVRGAPYAAGLAWSLLYRQLTAWGQGPPGLRLGSLWSLGFLAPRIATLLFYLWLIALARGRLRSHPAGADSFQPSEVLRRLLSEAANFIGRARRWPAP